MKEQGFEQKAGRSCSACATDIFENRSPQWKQKKIAVIIVSAVLLGVGVYFEFFAFQQLVAQALFLGTVLVSGRQIIKKGILSAVHRHLDMNFLISVAAAGAFLIGHGEEGAAVILLFFIAEFLEDYAAERARTSVAALLKLAPETVTIKKNGKEETIHTHKVKVGDIMVVKPGDQIPLDGVVLTGFSSVNQAPITGESIPVSKTAGSTVFAGTLNEDGYLEIRVTKKSGETMLSKIVSLVEEAQQKKSKTEAFIDTFARYYTPLVLALALLVVVIPPVILGLPFNVWLYRGLVLLVVSCPCAVAISTPVSMVSGITSAAKNGVLIKGGNHIEELRKVKVMVFDKTGTLTRGVPEVTGIVAVPGQSEEAVLRMAAALELKSKHPLAKSIVRYAKEKGIAPAPVSGFNSITGKGIKGKIGKKLFFVGNKNLFAGTAFNSLKKQIKYLEEEGKTVVLVGTKNRVMGVIALMDQIRSASFETVHSLKKRGVKTVMLTGDNMRAARAIAHKLGIDEYFAELLPKDKVFIIDELLKKYSHVVMVGDGVNDAPALAKAHVGIAMGAIGSDAAIEAADIALMQDDISKVNYLVILSEKTMSIVKQNIFVSIVVKGSFALMAFPGIITLWVAVAVGDMGLSLAVILNALRIGRVK